MRLLLDECVSPRTFEALRDRGFDVERVASSPDDASILEKAVPRAVS